MKFVFLGPPGAGKGTLASKIADYYGIPHISTGEMFRAAIRAETELGKQIKAIIHSGGLVSDEITVALVKERLSCTDVADGFILDGFPRTIFQAEELQKFCTLNTVVDFVIDDAVVIERLSGRCVCTICGKSYNTASMKPKVEGTCDDCKGTLIVRADDKKEAVIQRLQTYRDITFPLIDFYEKVGILARLEADASPDDVFAAFKKRFPRKES